MPDDSKLFAFIESCDDAEKLQEMVKKARAQKHEELEKSALRRLAQIFSLSGADDLEMELWRTIYILESVLTAERGRTTRLSRTRQKLARTSVKETLEGWAKTDKATDGFRMLVERGMPELTGEAIILRHKDRFSADVIDAAEARLRPYENH